MKCVDWIVELVRVLFYVEVWEQQQSSDFAVSPLALPSPTWILHGPVQTDFL